MHRGHHGSVMPGGGHGMRQRYHSIMHRAAPPSSRPGSMGDTLAEGAPLLQGPIMGDLYAEAIATTNVFVSGYAARLGLRTRDFDVGPHADVHFHHGRKLGRRFRRHRKHRKHSRRRHHHHLPPGISPRAGPIVYPSTVPLFSPLV